MFSVVIPVFNHERYLTQCVISAASSPLVSEVLLLDDGSSDGSYELIRRLSRGALAKVRDVTPLPRVNRGAHVALNELVAQARCEWIAVLNSDDAFIANRFALVERKLRQEDCDLVFGDLTVIDDAGRQLGRKRGPFDPQVPFPGSFNVARMARDGHWTDLLSHQNLIATTSNILFKKSLLRKIGGFALYRYIHDWDFVLRASLLGQILYLPHPLTAYRTHSGNTIKESSRKVDAEVREMFAKLSRDFPELARRDLFQIGLSENTYLQPALPRLLHVATSDTLYIQAVGDSVVTSDTAQYVYAPADILQALSPIHLQNAALALTFQDLDYVIVSHGLDAPKRDHVITRTAQSGGEQRGRILRLLPGRHFSPDAARESTCEATAAIRIREEPEPNVLRCVQERPKPIVFILPALFAVGGVERLVIDMMRQLRGLYDFVLITTERLSEQHGSLHGQTEGIALGFYDLAELAAPELFLPMMRRLREVYRPALVWICNGAPWQCDNASGIREVFADIPIVDQQAYDTEAGWIARYADAGIQSYDRFIAINTKIQDTFIRKYGIDPKRIDMIYHSVNLQAVGPMSRSQEECAAYRTKYGLPPAGRIFGWVGRLTRQKRPLEFLEFTRRVAGNDRHFVMIGNGELAAECDAFIARHALTNVTPVRFSNQMGELFAAMSGLLGTSEYEGLPISMLEALSMGVPIFSTDVGDVGVVLEQYETGEVTEAHWDLERYLAGFEKWLAALSQWQERAREAAPKIRDRFEGQTVAREYDESWRRAIADAASRTTNHDITAGF
jgi:glycosyltransferase involved in cell wall biosynthesis